MNLVQVSSPSLPHLASGFLQDVLDEGGRRKDWSDGDERGDGWDEVGETTEDKTSVSHERRISVNVDDKEENLLWRESTEEPLMVEKGDESTMEESSYDGGWYL